MKKSTIFLIFAVLLILGGGWYWYSSVSGLQGTAYPNGGDEIPLGNTTPTGNETPIAPPADTAPMAATITYTAAGFTPSSITIKKGGTVTWVNDGGGNMWVGSAMHPTHTAYDGTTLAEHCATSSDGSFDQCKNGDTYSFTFDKVGKWNYHNHSRSSHFGSVTVVE